MSYIDDKITEIRALLPTLQEEDREAVEKLIRDTILKSYKNGVARGKGDGAPRKKADMK